MVGGTNPSLLEAMASRSLIAAHQNPFNRAILNGDAYYFNDSADVRRIIDNSARGPLQALMIANNLRKIREEYTWKRIIDQYHAMILKSLQSKPITLQLQNPEQIIA